MIGKPFEDRLREILDSMEHDQLELETVAARANPRGNRLTRVMADGKLSYRCYAAGSDGRGRRVRFCWSCHRNVAGYFLGWREVESKRLVVRSQWVARKIRRRVQELAVRRMAAFKARRGEGT